MSNEVEWTDKRVLSLISTCGGQLNIHPLTDAINAALAAEKAKNTNLAALLDACEKELDTEREKWGKQIENMGCEIADERMANKKLREQFAAAQDRIDQLTDPEER